MLVFGPKKNMTGPGADMPNVVRICWLGEPMFMQLHVCGDAWPRYVYEFWLQLERSPATAANASMATAGKRAPTVVFNLPPKKFFEQNPLFFKNPKIGKIQTARRTFFFFF